MHFNFLALCFMNANFLDNLCLVRIKYALVGFYGRLSGCRAPDLVANPILLDRKLELSEQLLSVLNKTEPGISSAKGVIYYEMHVPIFLKAQMKLSCGLIDANLAEKEFEKSIDCIEKSMEHLKYNSRGSFGNQLYIGAQDTLKKLYEHIKKIKNLA